jgi:putative transposase
LGTWESTELGVPVLFFLDISREAWYAFCTMPRGLIRYEHTGSFHFLTFSCYHRFQHLGGTAARDVFEDALERVRQRYRFVVVGYVVMPEHVHLLIGEPVKGTVSGVIHALKLSVAQRRAERPFWQARYYDFLVHNEEKRVEKLRYMHRNPVVRGLAEKPEEWAWSSFRHYATGAEGRVEIESEWTAARRGNHLPEHLRYREQAG